MKVKKLAKSTKKEDINMTRFPKEITENYE